MKRFREVHWSYYLTIESDVEAISRYIEFAEDNFNVYSIELTRLLLATCSEIDVAIKLLCEALDPGSKPKNIHDYKKVVRKFLPKLVSTEAKSRKYGFGFTPWMAWEGDKDIDWWISHNNVKHNRSNYFYDANLRNVLNAVAALYLVNIYCHHQLEQKLTEFPLDFRNTLPRLEVGRDLFRINDPFAYSGDF